MAHDTTRRDVLKTGLAAAGLGMLGLPEWALPVLAQGETVVPFGDWPEKFDPNPAPDRRLFDTRSISGPYTPKDQFFTTQHYGHPVVDAATYRLNRATLQARMGRVSRHRVVLSRVRRAHRAACPASAPIPLGTAGRR